MKKKLGVVLLCSFSILTACAPGQEAAANVTQTEASLESSQEAGTTESELQKNAKETNSDVAEDKEAFNSLKELAGLLGSSDGLIKDSFGGGTENKTEDGSILIGREYQTSFKGEDITMFTVYDDNENVMMVQVMLPGKDSQKYIDDISKELNMEPEGELTGEGGGASTNWNSDGVMYTLHISAGESILEIIVPQS